MAVLEMRNESRPCPECSKKDAEIERLLEHSKACDATYEVLSKALDSYKAKAEQQKLDVTEARIEERDFWELNIKDEALRAGLDPSGTVGCATLHMLGEEITKMKEAVKGDLDKILEQTNKQVDEATRREGYVAGVRAFAWWKDGVEYVGSGTTLADAIEKGEQD